MPARWHADAGPHREGAASSARNARRSSRRHARVPAVWRSEEGGGKWKRLTKGLPKKESFFTIQRDAWDIDELKAPAIYFGMTTGS